jgi:O-antigen/teichoic acid export membrane protein
LQSRSWSRLVTSTEIDTDPPAVEAGSIRSGVWWKLAAGVVNDVMRLGIVFILARLLSPEEFGLASMTLVISGFALLFSDLALGAGLVQMKTITELDRSTMFWISVGVGALLTVVGVGVSGLIAALFNEPRAQTLLAVMSLAFLFTSLGSTQAALLTRSMNFRVLELRVTAATAVGGIAGIAVAVRGGGPWAIVTQQLALAAMSTVLLWFASAWRPHLMFSGASIRKVGRFSAYLLGNRVVFLAERTAVPVIIGRFLGAASLGLYTLGYNLAFMPVTRITLPVQEVLFPAFSREQDQQSRLSALWLKSLSLGSAVTVPALAGLIVIAPDFVSVVLGEKWSQVAPVIQVLAWAALMKAIQGPSTSLVLAIDRADALFWLSLLSLMTTTGFLAVGVQWGIQGATVAIACSATLLSVLWMGIVSRQASSSLGAVRRALTGVFVATTAMAVSVAALRAVLVTAGVVPAGRLVLSVAFGIVVYAAVLRWRDPAIFSSALANLPGSGRITGALHRFSHARS